MLGPHQLNQVITGHCLEVLKGILDAIIHCCVTSPPYYGLRDYGLEPVYWPAVTFAPMPGLPPITIPEQVCCLGLEKDIWSYVGHLVAVFREVKRVLRDDGVLWLNLGDSYCGYKGDNYLKVKDTSNLQSRTQVPASHNIGTPHTAGLKPKDLMLIPARVALALQADGWYLRSDCIWHKPNPMPESVTDRPTKAHEYVFLMSKSERYYYDAEAIKEPSIRPGEVYTFGGQKARAGQSSGGDPRNGHRTIDNSQWGKDYETKKSRNRRTVWTVAEKLSYETFQDWIMDKLAEDVELYRALMDDFEEEQSKKSDVWQIATQPYAAAHFATFPPRLIEPMILASTSEYGVCGECGGPWVRVIEKKPAKVTKPRPFAHNGNDDRRDTGRVYEETESTTTGWRPSCACDAPTVPAVVLDPFGGSGTTGEVALTHRRNFILIDANPTYATELAAERLNGTQITMGVF